MTSARTRAEVESEVDLLIDSFNAPVDDLDPELARARGHALDRLAKDLLILGRLDEAVGWFDQAAAALWDFETERGSAVYARWRQAETLSKLTRSEEAIEVLDEVVGEIGVDWSYPQVPDLMAIVLALWVGLLDYCGHLERAEVAANAVLARYQPAFTPASRMAVANALTAKASLAISQDASDEALEFLDKTVELCRPENNDDYQDEFLSLLSHALIARADLLEDAGRIDAAIADYDEILARWDPGSTEEVVLAAREDRSRLID